MFYRQLTEGEFNDLASRILYEDNHILAVYKKAGEIVQGDKTGDETLCDKYKAFIAERNSKPGQVYLGIPHRIDRPVCGITIFAKTSKSLERLNAMFRDGEVHKTYWALVCSKPEPEEADLENWMTRNEKMNKSFIVKGKNAGKEAKLAKLHYKLIGQTDRYFLLEVLLYTGRHHQNPLPVVRDRLPDKGRPEIRRATLQQRRWHLTAGQTHKFHSSCQQTGNRHHRASSG